MQETPARIDTIVAALDADGRFVRESPGDHGRSAIDAVHDPAMVDFVAGAHAAWSGAAGHDIAIPDVFLHPGLRSGMPPSTPPKSPLGALGYWCFETTTPMVAGTYAAARAAVDCALTATDIARSTAGASYALCRPPGHHAATAVFGGYFFFNNAAIAAQHAITNGADRVAILDVDYHHGNGTQQIFYDRADVFYASLHGDPDRAYPYFVGHAHELGTGHGHGCNVNVPLPEGCDDGRYLDALGGVLTTLEQFAPDLLVVSLGLDLYADDPLGDFAVTTNGIGAVGEAIASLHRPTVILQEGGYAVAALGDNAVAFLDAFTRLIDRAQR